MQEKNTVSYTEWFEFVKAVKCKGYNSHEMNWLTLHYPKIEMQNQAVIIQNNMADLETILLKKVVDNFQKCLNQALEEVDTETLEAGIRELKRNIKKCFFFFEWEDFSYAIKKEISSQMIKHLSEFILEYEKFVRTLSQCENSVFCHDFEYISKKAGLKKYIEGFNLYV